MMKYFFQIFRNKYAFAFLALIFVLAVTTLIFSNSPLKISQADSNGLLTGWAWSSNIGWVDFNCQDRSVCATSNYNVQINPSNGTLSGYAWSSNIGWIQFNPAGPYPASPSNSAKIDLTTGIASGWMKALSYGGGWDGWIKITDAKVTSNKFQGWAWGSLVVGWLNFYNVTVSNITIPTNPGSPTSTPPFPQTSLRILPLVKQMYIGQKVQFSAYFDLDSSDDSTPGGDPTPEIDVTNSSTWSSASSSIISVDNITTKGSALAKKVGKTKLNVSYTNPTTGLTSQTTTQDIEVVQSKIQIKEVSP